MPPPHYCRKSPTKAHHWMFRPQGSDDPYTATCKYCGKRRKFMHKGYYDLCSKDEVHTKAMTAHSRPTVGKKVS